MKDKITEPYTIENFYGVYLLHSLNENYFGRTYIGFTVDPNRRIKQHNNGIHAGGAKRTSNKGPWNMVLIVHGFPNNVAALRFEWAWQNPENSIRLHHVSSKKRIARKESHLQYRIRILSEMLNVGPWNRLPLTIRWLDENSENNFEFNKIPPLHMPICQGAIKSKKICNSQEIKNNFNIELENQDVISSKQSEINMIHYDKEEYHRVSAEININETKFPNKCIICLKSFSGLDCIMPCLYFKCDSTSHITCLANLFLDCGEYLPIEGRCPKCKNMLLWGDLIRKIKGCNDNDVEEDSDHDNSISDSFDSSASECPF